jgi:hypothetical protein
VVTWIVIAVVVLALLVLVLAVLPVLGRLNTLQRALRRLQLRQEEAMRLQEGAAVLEASVAALQQRAEFAQEQMTAIRGGQHGQPAFLDR